MELNSVEEIRRKQTSFAWLLTQFESDFRLTLICDEFIASRLPTHILYCATVATVGPFYLENLSMYILVVQIKTCFCAKTCNRNSCFFNNPSVLF